MKRNFIRSVQVLSFMTGLFLVMSCAKDDIIVTDIILDKNDATIQVGANTTLSAYLTPPDATNRNITWRSANIDIATVANGVVTGISLGTTTITAISNSDTTVQSICSVVVTPSTGQVITVEGDITSDTKWYATAKYMLSGFVYVKNNATLTIEPGTIIKGVSNTKLLLGIVAIMPYLLQLVMPAAANNAGLFLVSSSGLLIVVGVVREMFNNIEAELKIHGYAEHKLVS